MPRIQYGFDHDELKRLIRVNEIDVWQPMNQVLDAIDAAHIESAEDLQIRAFMCAIKELRREEFRVSEEHIAALTEGLDDLLSVTLDEPEDDQ